MPDESLFHAAPAEKERKPMADNLIETLEDERACEILARIARSALPSGAAPISLSADLRQALANTFHPSPQLTPVSEGELARQALLVLAEDPGMRQAIHDMAISLPETPAQYDAGLTAAITTAVIFVLQSYVSIERDKQGRWSVTFEKKPTSDTLLKGLVQKLLGYVPGGR
jgi:hypothetical protein